MSVYGFNWIASEPMGQKSIDHILIYGNSEPGIRHCCPSISYRNTSISVSKRVSSIALFVIDRSSKLTIIFYQVNANAIFTRTDSLSTSKLHVKNQ